MPSERSPFESPVEPISPPPEPSENEGLGWRRRVPPPGPKEVFRCPFIGVFALRRLRSYKTRDRKREGFSAVWPVLSRLFVIFANASLRFTPSAPASWRAALQAASI